MDRYSESCLDEQRDWLNEAFAIRLRIQQRVRDGQDEDMADVYDLLIGLAEHAWRRIAFGPDVCDATDLRRQIAITFGAEALGIRRRRA